LEDAASAIGMLQNSKPYNKKSAIWNERFRKLSMMESTVAGIDVEVTLRMRVLYYTHVICQ